MLTQIANSLLRQDEGVERFPYKDTKGKLTIGVGFNLDDVGLYPEEIDFILNNRISLLNSDLKLLFPVYRYLNTVRKVVLLNMAYNMGLYSLKKFRKMWAALEMKDYKLAATEMQDSKWYRQDVPNWRSERLINMMRTGEMSDETIC